MWLSFFKVFKYSDMKQSTVDIEQTESRKPSLTPF